jgi:hypothetical protein
MRQPSWALRAGGVGAAHVALRARGVGAAPVPFAQGTDIQPEANIAQLVRRVVVRLRGHLRRPAFGIQRSCSRIPDCAMR